MTEQISKYGYVRLAVISPEMRIADVDFNTKKILEAISNCEKESCQIILFPELNITGYSCGDLFFQSKLLHKVKESISEICSKLKNKDILVVLGAPLKTRGKLFNTAVVINNGQILGIVPKTYLCNSSEYYEERWFSSEYDRVNDYIQWNGQKIPFGADLIFEQTDEPNSKIGIEICEDLWAVKSPSLDLALAGAQVLLNLSASNEVLTKSEYRRELVRMQSARCLSTYAICSSGANESSTDTVYSGHSIIAENGMILNETVRFSFQTQIAIADIDIEKLENERIKNNSFGISKASKDFRIIPFSLKNIRTDKLHREINKNPFVPKDINSRREVCEEIFAIQTTGLIQRLKYIDTKKIVIGLSGGLDSTLALLVAYDAFKKLRYNLKNILAVNMPGPGTSKGTKSNAEDLAKLLKINFNSISIEKSLIQHLTDIGHSEKSSDVTFENAQARERTQILMDLANKNSGIVLGTGDLSEIALGWSTYNADHMSMYNVNSGVPKTLVKYIIQWVAEEKFSGKMSEVLNGISNTPISPELLPADSHGRITQKTEDIIGPYELHDFFLYNFVRMNYSPEKILFLANKVFSDSYRKNDIQKWLKVFYKRFFSNQFKRSCMPDGIKVGTVSLSPRADWRMPSDANYELWIKDIL
ncbi:NAD(+) synthase [Bacteroidetes/Chlorobi group bacterium ChocPot_Mid]|nr:MAG: NAD(+) synthase [Bacteroidetes/Chlorobi group bacterium ChocPot_Mid]